MPALGLISALILFAPMIDGGSTHLAVMVIRLIIIGLLGLFCYATIQSEMLRFPRLPVDLPVAIFLLIAFAAAVTSPYQEQSRQWLIVLVSYAVLLHLVVFFVRQWKDVVVLVMVCVAVAVIQAGMALYQTIAQAVSRPTGTFFNPNFLAGYLAIVIIVLFGVGCHARFPRFGAKAGKGRGNIISTMRATAIWWWVGGAGAFVLILAGLVVSGSRGGLLAAFCGMALVASVKYGYRGALVLLGAAVLLVLLANPLRGRIEAEHAMNPLTYARWQMWTHSAWAIASEPLGTGLGLYQYISPKQAFPIDGQIARYGKVATTPHNEYLQIGVELGLTGLVLFCWGATMVLKTGMSIIRPRLHRWQRGLVVGSLSAVAAILIHAAVDSNLHEPPIALMLVLLTALLFVMRRFHEGPAEVWRVGSLSHRWLHASVAMLGLIAVTVLVVRIGHGWTVYEQGVQAQQRRDLPAAIQYYESAIALNPDKALYHSALASAHFQSYQLTHDRNAARLALEELQAATALNPLDGRLFGLLGYVYTYLAETTVELNPGVLQRPSLLYHALTSYQRAVEREPFSPFHRLEIAKLYLFLGKRREAVNMAESAVQLEPNFLPAREWLARIYVASGEIDQMTLAEDHYREITRRLNQYALTPKDSLERRYLTVDLTGLTTTLQRKSASAS